MDKDYILQQVRSAAAKNGGKPLGSIAFHKSTGIRERDWRGKGWNDWNNFGDILEEAGFARNEWTRRLDDSVVIQKLIELIRELGHFPRKTEFERKAARDESFPSPGAFRRRGRKRELAQLVLLNLENRPEFNDVRDVCEDVVGQTNSDSRPEDDLPRPSSKGGTVYLVRSGRRYKIGRTERLERRVSELSYQSPQPTELVHEFRTDDPVGIERYWLDRFADKRKHGEWFALSAADVSAFKRRRGFM